MFNTLQDSLTLTVLGVFLCQLALITFYLPFKWRRNRRQMFEQHPQSQYPKLYAQPLEVELARLNIRKYCDVFVGLMGIGLVIYTLSGALSVDELSIILLVFSGFQILPRAMTGRWIRQNTQLLKERGMHVQTQKTVLVARQLSNFVSTGYLAIAITTYVISVTFGIFLYLGDMWKGASGGIVALLALDTLMVVFLAWLIYSSLYGPRKDFYQSHVDRMARIGNTIRQCVSLIAIYNVFIMLLFMIVVYGFGLAHNYMITSFCLQLMLFLQSRKNSERDFSVYKADPD